MDEMARYVSVGRFSALVGLSDRTCWTLIKRGVLPVYKVGRRTLIKTHEGFEALERFAIESANSKTDFSKVLGPLDRGEA